MIFRAVAFAVLSYIITGGTALGVAPQNDDYANRTPLTAAGSQGTTAGATTEAGEPTILRGLPVTGTVWWSFTPAASGWYGITVSSGAIDPVVAVYTGSTVISLVRIASADDDALDGTVNTSRVWFHAAAGTSYSIQAGGHDAAIQGTLFLQVQPILQPPNRVTSLTYAPGPAVNATLADQTIAVTFTLALRAAFDFGVLSVARPDGSLLAAIDFSATERIAGTSTAGTYRVNVTVPRYAPAGNYPIWIIGNTIEAPDVPDLQAGGWTWTSFPAASTTQFTVTNTGSEDTVAPSLVSAVFSQPSIDVTAAGVLVPLTLQLADNLSGLATAAVSLEHTIAGDQRAVLATGTVTAANRTAGDPADGRYAIQFFVPQDAPAAVWQLRCVLSDRVGNQAEAISTATLTVNKNPYLAWTRARGLNGPAADPAGDPDFDGQTNLEEFAFHTDPKVGQFESVSLSVPAQNYLFQGALPLQFHSGDRLHFRFLRRRGANAGNITTAVQFGSSLSDWTPATELAVTPLSADWEMVEARDNATVSAASRRLGRIVITAP